jgi:hypothetical protein
MNQIIKRPLHSIGYQFVHPDHLPPGADEYYLRNQQNNSGIRYRNLTAYEIEVLVRNNNTSDDWNKLQVSDAFNPELVKNCKFFGLVRIGKLETVSLEYHNVTLPVGLYNSTVLSCDFGDNVVINNVNYLSHYIIGNEVMISNVHEIHVTDHAKFGNGIIKEGESEGVRVWVEVCNENAGRKILPFDGMLPGDAYLWSRHRQDEQLLQRFKEFTEKKFDRRRGYYGTIGDRCVIKNTSIIKDVWIGSDAYIKGANKLKNLTIKSGPGAQSQIGEGCELVNGIIDYGCRIFYGVKAVRFVMASHSQLKYGARLINSYLGNNSTISCCEVLNSLIFPSHEQHHNNSFLCAALVMGQSNIAAGATIGSNHNSRAADGELVTGRGFWPGLCVSLKHNSRFATFTLLAKGDYPAELDIPLPFSLVSNDVAQDRLVVMPAYWFLYNLYALARNAGKYQDRDKRTVKVQGIETDYLAPDSINETFAALELLARETARAAGTASGTDLAAGGHALLADPGYQTRGLTIQGPGLENSSRQVVLIKVKEAYDVYRRLIRYYGMLQLLELAERLQPASFADLKQALPPSPVRQAFGNIGGQLLPQPEADRLLGEIRKGEIGSWEEVHEFYSQASKQYGSWKLEHAYASLLEVTGRKAAAFDQDGFLQLLEEALATKQWMVTQIHESREKDYTSAFRKMVYNSEEEMEAVIGKLEDNSFLLQQQKELAAMTALAESLRSRFR